MALGSGNNSPSASLSTPYAEDWRHPACQGGWPSSIELFGTDAVCRVPGSQGGRPFILSVPRYAPCGDAAADHTGDATVLLHRGVGDEAASAPPDGTQAPLAGALTDSMPTEHQGSYKPGEMLVKSAFLAEPHLSQQQPPQSEANPPAALPVLLGRTRQTPSLYQLLAGAALKPASGITAATKPWQAEEDVPTAVAAVAAVPVHTSYSQPSWAVPIPSGEVTLGTPDCPTAGSRGHHFGQCKPCAFVFKGGCSNGVECRFCHLCLPGEKKRRKKERKALRREMAALRGVGMSQRGLPGRR